MRFIHENAFENIVGKMVAILSRPQGVKDWYIPFLIASQTAR